MPYQKKSRRRIKRTRRTRRSKRTRRIKRTRRSKRTRTRRTRRRKNRKKKGKMVPKEKEEEMEALRCIISEFPNDPRVNVEEISKNLKKLEGIWLTGIPPKFFKTEDWNVSQLFLEKLKVRKSTGGVNAEQVKQAFLKRLRKVVTEDEKKLRKEFDQRSTAAARRGGRTSKEHLKFTRDHRKDWLMEPK